MAEAYDDTRVFDLRCFGLALDFLVERFPPPEFTDVFEPGIGNGRIAIPLAARGYRVTGVDISDEILALLEKRLRETRRTENVSYQKADAVNLPFGTGEFDMAVVVHLLYFIRDWRKAADEILT